MDGLTDRTLKKIRLPSMAWQWESDWHLELSLDGQPLDHDVSSGGMSFVSDFIFRTFSLILAECFMSIFAGMDICCRFSSQVLS